MIKSSVRNLVAMSVATICIFSPCTYAEAKTFDIEVDGHMAPWISRQNSRYAFGIGDNHPPRMIWNASLRKGTKVRFSANGGVSWITGGVFVGPDGDPSMMIDRSMTYLPSHYINRTQKVGMGGLVGAFVTADGTIVGKPFVIGEHAEVTVPSDAAAISLGINDDKFTDNSGSFKVQIDVGEATVTVEQ